MGNFSLTTAVQCSHRARQQVTLSLSTYADGGRYECEADNQHVTDGQGGTSGRKLVGNVTVYGMFGKQLKSNCSRIYHGSSCVG